MSHDLYFNFVLRDEMIFEIETDRQNKSYIPYVKFVFYINQLVYFTHV